MVINTTLIEFGDALARREGNGEFAIVWEQLIKRTIYDYRQDIANEEKESDESPDELVDRLIQEFGQ